MSKSDESTKGKLQVKNIEDSIAKLIGIRDKLSHLSPDGIDAVMTSEGALLIGDAQASITQSEARYRHIINRMSALVLELSPTGSVTYLNNAITSITGFSPEDWVGRNCFDLLLPEQETSSSEVLCNQFLNSGELSNFLTRIRTQDGSKKVLSWNSAHVYNANGQIERLIFFGTDITQQNLAYESLRESEELLRGSHIIAGLGSYVLDIPSGRWKSTEMLNNLFGISEDYEHTLDGWAALIHAEDRTRVLDYFKNEVLGKGKIFDKEYRIIRPADQAERWIHGMGKLELDANGRPVKMLGTIQDITEFKLAELKLRIAATAFESQEGIVVTDSEGAILQVNRAFTAITGYSAEDAIGNNPRMLQSGRQDANFYKAMWKTILQSGYWEGG